MQNYKVSSKETPYLILMIAISVCAYYYLGVALYDAHFAETVDPSIYAVDFYAAVFIIMSFITPAFLKGTLIGNGIKITEKQFPEYYAVIQKQANILGLKKAPESYIVQSGSMLNAFATRIYCRDYMVLYSALLTKAENEGKDAVEFIIGHELGHIKRKHVSTLLNVLTLPAHLVPFLFKAYSRSREYTCDSIGASLAPAGAEKGLVLLSAGTDLFSQINVDDMIHVYQSDKCWSSWFFEILSTHPLTIKRIMALRKS
jgi:Zn-dependent protease with chaperone function